MVALLPQTTRLGHIRHFMKLDDQIDVLPLSRSGERISRADASRHSSGTIA